MLGRGVSVSRYRPWMQFLALALVFGISHGQYPLYYFVQNQYFLYGLARADLGLLKNDWLASTTDPWPVFSWLVEFTYRYVDQRAFYVYYIVLLGIYAYSLLGIASRLTGIAASRTKYLLYLAVLVALHSPVSTYLSETLLGFNLSKELVEGVASQRILWDMFTPSAFGALLLLSVHLFLRGRQLASLVSAVLAAVFHPVYTLSAAALVLAYLFIMLRRGEATSRVARFALTAGALIAPVVISNLVLAAPTSPEVWREAQSILVRLRLYHHAIPARWLGDLYVRIPLVLAALYLVRRTEVFWIMLVSAVIATGLTFVQVLTGSNTLALIFPWRLSVYLVPLSTAIILAYGLPPLLDRLGKRLPAAQTVLTVLGIIVLVASFAAGAGATARRWQKSWGPESEPLLRFVSASKAPGDIYLIPQRWRYFRLATGAPVFVDYWFVPYNDVAVLEWNKRLRLVDEFYAAAGESRCKLQREISVEYRVTHVVVTGQDTAACGNWKMVFENRDGRVYRVTPQ